MGKNKVSNNVTAYLDNDDSPDIENPIHSTEVARAYGYDGPLIGGVTVWGWATDTIIQALGNDWITRGWSEYSFRKPVFPGNVITITAESDAEDLTKPWNVTMNNQSGDICVIGKIGLGQTKWENTLTRPVNMSPSEATEKPPLTLDRASQETSWTALEVEFNDHIYEEINHKNRLTFNSIFDHCSGMKPIAHPSWIAGWAEALMRHNFDIPSSMHTKSLVKHHSSVPLGTTIVGGAEVIDAYERKGHHYVEFDVLLKDTNEKDIAQIRHRTIFRIATASERTGN